MARPMVAWGGQDDGEGGVARKASDGGTSDKCR